MVFQTVPAVEVGFAAEREREKKTEIKRKEELGCMMFQTVRSRIAEKQRDRETKTERGAKRETEREEVPGCMMFQTVPAVEVGSAAEIAQRERERDERDRDRDKDGKGTWMHGVPDCFCS